MHRPRKRFGQHFLQDREVVARIIDAFNPRPDDLVVEIGPGRGALTGELLKRTQRLHAVELDRDLITRLQAQHPDSGELILHNADAMRFNYRALCQPGQIRQERIWTHEGRPQGARQGLGGFRQRSGGPLPRRTGSPRTASPGLSSGAGQRSAERRALQKLRLIGNLPYNISTPLLFHLLDQADCIRDMLFMLQKEVVDRLSAAPGGKDYGRLSVMVQYRCQVERLFSVPPSAFSPAPRVQSSVVRLVPYATSPVDVRHPERFAKIVAVAFTQRRKTLRNSLKNLIGLETFTALGIDPMRRAETLSLTEFALLANSVKQD